MSSGQHSDEQHALAAHLQRVHDLAVERHSSLHQLPTFAAPTAIERAIALLPHSLPFHGQGADATLQLVHDTLLPALSGQAGPRYFGFVTGGVLPEALVADWITTLYDQNVQVHLPHETICTYVEQRAIAMAAELVGLDPTSWNGTVATGATASNIMGLTCAREALGQRLLGISVAEEGVHAGPQIFVLAAQAHASIRKAAAQVGIGRANVRNMSRKPNPSMNEPEARAAGLEMDLDSVELLLKNAQAKKEACIVVAGMGEVNTGALTAQLPTLRKLCTTYGAWLHVDAAFCGFVGLVEEFAWVASHLAMADSITTDGHKTLNQPYDCGLFFIRTTAHQTAPSTEQSPLLPSPNQSWMHNSYGPGGDVPAYLVSGIKAGNSNYDRARIPEEALALPSPLNNNIENSRRFRALPLYVSLVSRGQDGFRALVQANLRTASVIDHWMRTEGSQALEVLTPKCTPPATSTTTPQPWSGRWGTTIVLFRPRPSGSHPFTGSDGAQALARAINATRKVYVTGTAYAGIPAIRLAVSNWSTTPEDEQVVLSTLRNVLKLPQ